MPYGYEAKTSAQGPHTIAVKCSKCGGTAYVSPQHDASACKCPYCGKDPIGG